MLALGGEVSCEFCQSPYQLDQRSNHLSSMGELDSMTDHYVVSMMFDGVAVGS